MKNVIHLEVSFDLVIKPENYKGYEFLRTVADFLYITNRNYLYEVEVKISIADFRADQKKTKYHDHPDVKGFYYFVSNELYSKHKDEIKTTCKEKGAGLIVDGCPIATVLKPKIRKDVKPLTDNGYIHYLRLFAKKWVRQR
nr:MAG TPA: DNA repair protein MmcB-like [Caudoviricetes sp.]